MAKLPKDVHQLRQALVMSAPSLYGDEQDRSQIQEIEGWFGKVQDAALLFREEKCFQKAVAKIPPKKGAFTTTNELANYRIVVRQIITILQRESDITWEW
jgi:hypothetical protein